MDMHIHKTGGDEAPPGINGFRFHGNFGHRRHSNDPLVKKQRLFCHLPIREKNPSVHQRFHDYFLHGSKRVERPLSFPKLRAGKCGFRSLYRMKWIFASVKLKSCLAGIVPDLFFCTFLQKNMTRRTEYDMITPSAASV